MNVDILISTIKSILNDDSIVEKQNVQKGNITLTGICIGKGNMRPVVYLENYEELFNEFGYEKVAREMIDVCNNAESLNVDTDEIASWNYAKRHLIICIAPKGTNVGSVTIPYLDLELYFRVKLGKEKDRMTSYKVKEEMLDRWNVTKETLLQVALNRTDYIISSMAETIMEILSDDEIPDDIIDSIVNEVPQIIVTNREKLHGASAIYDKQIFKKIANKYESDLYIIPSSIHELIVLPVDSSIPLSGINEMIREVNETQVAPEERLSDHVYIFRRDTMEIEW